MINIYKMISMPDIVLHFSKYPTTLSIKKFSTFRHSTAVEIDLVTCSRKVGMLTQLQATFYLFISFGTLLAY